MAPTRVVGRDHSQKKQGKLNFTNKAGEETPPMMGTGEEDLNLKEKGTGNHRGKKQRQHGTPIRGSIEEEENDGETMDTDTEQGDVGAVDGSPVQAIAVDDQFQAVEFALEFKILQGLKITTTGIFPALEDRSNPRLGPAKDLYVGENFVKRLVISHGGKYSDQITKDTKLIIIGEVLGKSKVEKALSLGIYLVMYESVQELLAGEISLKALFDLPMPKILEYSQEFGPSSIIRKPVDAVIRKAATPVLNPLEEPGLDKEAPSTTIRFSNTKQTKRKQPTTTPERPKVNLVPGSEVIA
jgi:hypothetical protein